MQQWRTFAIVAVLAGAVGAADPREWTSGIPWLEPKVIDPGTPTLPPSDAVVLFDGKSLDAWTNGDKWKIEDGYAIAQKTEIKSKQAFGDAQIHLEFATPAEVKGKGQGRGNSGFFLSAHYEVQILDSFENPTYFDGQCASIYKQMPPLVNACRKPGEWQTYDIIYHAPRFKADKTLDKPGTVTVLQNGVLVQDHHEILGNTSYDKPPAYTAHPAKMPYSIQFHGNPIRFRNIWVREIVPQGKKS